MFKYFFPSIKVICYITRVYLSLEIIEFLKGWILLLIEKNNIELNCIEFVYNDMKITILK